MGQEKPGDAAAKQTKRNAVGANVAATVHPIASQAALSMYKSGGNAVDAAIAAALCLGVVDGHNSGIGGGCLMLIRTQQGAIHAIDGREAAPAAASSSSSIPRPRRSSGTPSPAADTIPATGGNIVLFRTRASN